MLFIYLVWVYIELSLNEYFGNVFVYSKKSYTLRRNDLKNMEQNQYFDVK